MHTLEMEAQKSVRIWFYALNLGEQYLLSITVIQYDYTITVIQYVIQSVRATPPLTYPSPLTRSIFVIN